jgi:hypothetical protein
VLTARDAVTWLYHGREIAGQYKVLIVFAEREVVGRYAPFRLARCNSESMMLKPLPDSSSLILD